MPVVSSHNTWDVLEEAFLGIPDGACVQPVEPAFKASKKFVQFYDRPGKKSEEKILKAKQQIDNFSRVLQQQCNVKLRRPEPIEFGRTYTTPFFESINQYGVACPRDILLTLGNEIIESTMSWRSRFFEFQAYSKVLNELMDEDPDMLWTMAPKPSMRDEMYNLDFAWGSDDEQLKWVREQKFSTNETEPVFDAADVMRLCKDLIVQHGLTTNRKGIEWLRRHTKSRGYRVHEIHFPNDPVPVHIDATLVPLVPPTNERRGILMSCPDLPILQEDHDRLFKDSNWEVQMAPFPNTKIVPEGCIWSAWLSLNMLMVSPDRCIVEETEIPVINYLESLGIKCIRLPFRNVYEFGGSFHCTTADIRRRGERLDYFPNLQ